MAHHATGRTRQEATSRNPDLGQLYGVPTYRLNEAVKRNRKRFPADFMFQLDKKETESLTSQSAISKKVEAER
jgi:hypothetical protein